MAKPSKALIVPDLDNLPAAQPSNVGNSNALELPSLEEAKALGERVRKELEWIETSERMLPVRAVFLGIVLAQIRASLDRGQWGPWLKTYFRGKQSTAYNYIAIAKACVAEAKIFLPELIALRQLQLDLKSSNPRDNAGKALKKMERWVDGRSLRELYGEYANGQPKLGGARNGSAKKAVIDVEEVEALKREEAAGLIARARRLFVQENILQFLKPDEIRGVVESLEALATDVKAAARTILKKG